MKFYTLLHRPPLDKVCSQLVTSWFLQDCECTTIKPHRVQQSLGVFFLSFKSFTIKNSYESGACQCDNAAKSFPQTHCKRQ